MGMAHKLENSVSGIRVRAFQMSSNTAIKMPAKKSFRVLAGIFDKPKRLYATFFYLLLCNKSDL